MLKQINIALFIFAVGTSPLSFATAAAADNDTSAQDSKHIDNPHWRDDGCHNCHAAEASANNTNTSLINKDINEICNRCHEKMSAHALIHPVGMQPSKKMLKQMTKSMRQSIQRSQGRISCTSCHDLPMTCLKKQRHKKTLNPLFLRGGPYHDRTALCYNCHDKKKYQRLNAHEQISKRGKIRKEKCLLCHKSPELLNTDNHDQSVDFNVPDSDLSAMCTGCHLWIPHPGGSFSLRKHTKTNHLVVPPKDIMQHLQQQQQQNHIRLPLQPGNQQINCATCHDPHEEGVLKQKNHSHKLAEKRLRMPKQSLCLQCHDK